MSEKKSDIKPLLIVAVGEINAKDLARLNKNGFCVVEAKDPSKVRFADPPPLQYDAHDRAMIDLFRVVMARGNDMRYSREQLGAMYVDLLLAGTRPQEVKSAAKVAKN